jgi:hypothetical protein
MDARQQQQPPDLIVLHLHLHLVLVMTMNDLKVNQTIDESKNTFVCHKGQGHQSHRNRRHRQLVCVPTWVKVFTLPCKVAPLDCFRRSSTFTRSDFRPGRVALARRRRLVSPPCHLIHSKPGKNSFLAFSLCLALLLLFVSCFELQSKAGIPFSLLLYVSCFEIEIIKYIRVYDTLVIFVAIQLVFIAMQLLLQ